MTFGKVEWRYPYGFGSNPIELRFTNCFTEASETRTYKTLRAARAAETKFHNRMIKIYSQKAKKED